MDHFISSVEKLFSCDFEITEYLIFNFQWIVLDNTSLRVYVGMMDDYGLCLMIIEHTAFDYYFFLGK